nr:MAG TPA: hypothetical protein [Caudoviricetes sp.]
MIRDILILSKNIKRQHINLMEVIPLFKIR